jgi:hypothetical protein
MPPEKFPEEELVIPDDAKPEVADAEMAMLFGEMPTEGSVPDLEKLYAHSEAEKQLLTDYVEEFRERQLVQPMTVTLVEDVRDESDNEEA